MTYKEATERLEEILTDINNENTDIDKLTSLLKEAQKLIKFCKQQLTKTDDAINKLLEKDETDNK